MEKLKNKQGLYLTVLFFGSNCYSLLFAARHGAAVWLCYLLAWGLGIAAAYVLGTCMERTDGTFFALLDSLLPRPLGRFFTGLLAVYTFLSACTSLSIFGQFNQLTALSKTPTLILPLAVILLGVFACRSGISAMGRMASLTVWFSAVVFVLFVCVGLGSASPALLLETDRFSLQGGFTVFCNQLGDVLLLTAVYPYLARKRTRKRTMTIGMTLAGGMLFVISLVTVMTLGGRGVTDNTYPVFTVLSVRTVGQFVQHTELLTSVAMTVFAFFRVSLSLFFIAEALTRLFSLQNGRAPILPAGLLLASVTQLLYHGMPMLTARLESALSLWILIPIQIVLPALLCVICLLTKKSRTTLG